MKIFSYLIQASAIVNLNYCKEKYYKCKKDFDLVSKYRYSKYSLEDGILAIGGSALKNFRFFNPLKKIKFRNSSDQWFYLDRSKDSEQVFELDTSDDLDLLIRSFNQLFPYSGSPNLSLYSEAYSSLATYLDSSKNTVLQSKQVIVSDSNKTENHIHFLAGLLFACVNKDSKIRGIVSTSNNEISLLINSENNVSKTICLNYSQIECGQESSEAALSFAKSLQLLLDIDDSKTSFLFNSALLVKSFIGMYLNCSDEIVNLYRYIDNDLLEMFNLCISTLDIDSDCQQCIDSIYDIIYEHESAFPYSSENPTCWKMSIPDKDSNSGSGDEFFFNHVESSLYHFLNCLLWDKDKSEYIEIYQGSGEDRKLSKISSIFTGKTIKVATKEEMKKLHTLIENISSTQSSSLKNKGMSHQIVYLNNTSQFKCKIGSGMINYFRVVEVLVGREPSLSIKLESILKNYRSNIQAAKSLILDSIRVFLSDILPRDHNLEVEYVRCEDLKRFYFNNKRADFLGSIRVCKYFKDNSELVFSLRLKKNLACVEVESYVSGVATDHERNIACLLKTYKKEDAPRNAFIKMVLYRYLQIIDDYNITLDTLGSLLEDRNNPSIYDFLWLVSFNHTNMYPLICQHFLTLSNAKNQKLISNSISNFVSSYPRESTNTLRMFVGVIQSNFNLFYDLNCISNDFNLSSAFKEILKGSIKPNIVLAVWKSIFGMSKEISKEEAIDKLSGFLNCILFDELFYDLTTIDQKVYIFTEFTSYFAGLFSEKLRSLPISSFFPVIFYYIKFKPNLFSSRCRDVQVAVLEKFIAKMSKNACSVFVLEMIKQSLGDKKDSERIYFNICMCKNPNLIINAYQGGLDSCNLVRYIQQLFFNPCNSFTSVANVLVRHLNEILQDLIIYRSQEREGIASLINFIITASCKSDSESLDIEAVNLYLNYLYKQFTDKKDDFVRMKSSNSNETLSIDKLKTEFLSVQSTLQKLVPKLGISDELRDEILLQIQSISLPVFDTFSVKQIINPHFNRPCANSERGLATIESYCKRYETILDIVKKLLGTFE